MKLNKPQDDFRLLFDMENERRNIVKQYRFNPNLNKDFGVNRQYFARTKEEETGMEIEGFNLFLFETGIGFFTVKMNYQTRETDRILELNYLLSDVKRKESRLYYEANEMATDGEKTYTSLVAFMKKTLADYLPVYDFDERDGLDYVDRKPLNFSYYLLQERLDEESLGQLMFDARSNYRAAYKAPDAEKALRSANNLQTFENSYWGISINGATNISCRTLDERTDRFFEEEFIQRLQGIYLAMYLNVLNRYFTLKELRRGYLNLDGANIYIKEQAFKVAVDKNEIDQKLLKTLEKQEVVQLTKYCEEVKELNNRATIFTLKNAKMLPSNVEHVNTVYELMNRVYEIEETKQQLEKDRVSAKEIGDSYMRRINKLSEAVRELKKAKSEIFIYCLLTIFGFLSTFHDLVEIVEFFLGRVIWNTVYMWIPWTIIAIPVGVLCFKIVESVREYSEKKKELEDLILQ
ncbi:MAG: hypothetical protein J6A38_01405 [Clostridia bacterium]|nr:hypothetical protein [Clostridia bacterium]